MQVLSQSTVFCGECEPTRFAGFPCLCHLGGNEFLAAFQLGPAKNHAAVTAAIARSDDGGLSWSAPNMPFKAWADEENRTIHVAYLSQPLPGRLFALLMVVDHLGDSSLPFFNPETGGVMPIRIAVSESADGREWGRPVYISTQTHDHLPIPIMSPILNAGDGTLLFGFETSKNYEDPNPWEHYALCMRSLDSGKTWSSPSVVAHDPTGRFMFWDHRIAVLDDGSCADFSYAFDNQSGNEAGFHFTFSHDKGETWTAPAGDVGLPGQPWPIALNGNALAVVAVDRMNSRSIKIHLTPDCGSTWTDELTLYQDGKTESASFDFVDNINTQQNWNYGLPSGIRVTASEILVIWYCPSAQGTQIDCARVLIDKEKGHS